MHKALFAVLVAIVAIDICSSALPPQIKVCSKNTPNLADCIKNSMELLRPQLKTGDIAPGFKIEGLDPLYVGNMSINQGFTLNQWGTKAYGIAEFRVDKIRVNLDNFKVEMLLTVPKVSTKGKYELRYQLGAINIQGGGDGFVYLENVKVHLKITGSRYPKSGTEYLKIDNVKLDVKPSNIRVRLEGLFNGQKELENVGNEYINQNIDSLAKDIAPKIEQVLERKILRVANQVFEKAPYNEFFP